MIAISYGRTPGEPYKLSFQRPVHWTQRLKQGAVIIHHAGLGTCFAALAFNAFSVVVPATWEQQINAIHLQNLGGAIISDRKNALTNTSKLLGKILPATARTVGAELRIGVPNKTISAIIDR